MYNVPLPYITYRTLDRDPTSTIKAKLINTLREIKKNENIEEGMYKTM